MQGPEFRWGNSGLWGECPWARLRGPALCMTASEGLAEACTGQKGKRAGERGKAPGPVVEAMCTAWPWGPALPLLLAAHTTPTPGGQNSEAAPGPGAGPCPGSSDHVGLWLPWVVAREGVRDRAREQSTQAMHSEWLPSCILPVPGRCLKEKTDLEWGGESHTFEN